MEKSLGGRFYLWKASDLTVFEKQESYYIKKSYFEKWKEALCKISVQRMKSCWT